MRHPFVISPESLPARVAPSTADPLAELRTIEQRAMLEAADLAIRQARLTERADLDAEALRRMESMRERLDALDAAIASWTPPPPPRVVVLGVTVEPTRTLYEQSLDALDAALGAAIEARVPIFGP